MSQDYPPKPLGYESPVDPYGRPPPAGMAVASMVCGIVAVVLLACAWSLAVPLVLGIVAVSLGIVARRRAKRGVGGGRGMATAGVACGSVAAAINALAIAALVAFFVFGKGWSRNMSVRMLGQSATAQVSSYDAGLARFKADNGRFPTTAEGLAGLSSSPAGLTTWRGPYNPILPVDPWGHPYIYRCPGTGGRAYDLLSGGPDGAEGGGDDIASTR